MNKENVIEETRSIFCLRISNLRFSIDIVVREGGFDLLKEIFRDKEIERRIARLCLCCNEPSGDDTNAPPYCGDCDGGHCGGDHR